MSSGKLQEVKNIGRLLNHKPRNAATVAYRRWSFTRGFNCKVLTVRTLVFSIGGWWSHMGVRLYHYQGNGDGGPTWELYCIITRVLCSLKKKKNNNNNKTAAILQHHLMISTQNDVWGPSAENSSRVTTQIRVVLLSGRPMWEICFNQSETLTRSG